MQSTGQTSTHAVSFVFTHGSAITSAMKSDPPGRSFEVEKIVSRGEEVTSQVKENRRREADRIDAVEHAAVTLDRRAPVLHAAVALDRRHRQAAGEAHHRDDERHRRRLPELE